MSILDFLRRGRTKASDIPLVSRFLSFVANSQTNYFGSKRDDADYYTGWVYACVRAIAEEVAKIDLVLFKYDAKGNKIVISEHAAMNSLRSVNDFFTQHTLFERLQSNMELRGKEYWYVQPAKTKGLFEIYPLLPQYVKPVVDLKNYIASYTYTIDNASYNLNPDQVVPFRNFNPKSDIDGLSTLSAVREAVDTDNGAKDYNRAYFKNSGRPDVILEYPQSITPEDIQKLKTQWNEEFAGLRNGYKTAVAADGLKITTLGGGSHSDMEFIEQRRFSRDEILAIFRVPKIIVGIMEDVNRASAEAAMFAFMQWTILPKMHRIVDTLNEFYLPLFGDDTLRFEFTNKPPEDRTQVSQFIQSGINNGFLSPNDARRMIGLPEVEGGEQLYLPANLLSYGQPIQKSIVTQIDEPVYKVASDMAKGIVDLIQGTNQKVMDEMMEKKGAAKNAAQIRRQIGHEKMLVSVTKKLWKAQKQRAADNLQKELNKKSWRKLKVKQVALLDREKEVGISIDIFRPVVEEIVKTEGVAALEYLGLDGTEFDLQGPEVTKFVKQSTQKLAESITDTTIETLSDDIVTGLDDGLSVPELVDLIQQSTGFDAMRAERIARTESTRAGAQAEIAAWQDAGIVTSLIWWTGQDERVCPECNALHGTEVPIGDTFLTSDDLQTLGEDDYMGNGIDSPPRHPQCRCTLIPMIDEGKSIKPAKKSRSDDALITEYLANIIADGE